MVDVSSEDIYAACKDACVTIRSETGYCGSGFIVKHPSSDERYVITAAHLVEYDMHVLEASGNTGTTSLSPLTLYKGTNRIYFEYVKNGGGSAGTDSVLLDNIAVSNNSGSEQLNITFDGLSGTDDPIATATGDLVTGQQVSWSFVQNWENNGSGLTTTPLGDNNYALCVLDVEIPDDSTTYFLTVDYTVDSESDNDFFNLWHVPSVLFRQHAQVYIENLNNTGVHKSLPAVVVGVDGRNDVAVLRLASPDQSDYENLLQHPHVEFGDSSSMKIGGKIWMIGDPLCIDYRSIATGIVRDNKYIDDSHLTPESMWLDCIAYSGNSGSMVVNREKKVISMLTWGYLNDNSSGGGPPQHLIEKAVRYLLAQYDALNPSGAAPPSDPPPILMYPKAFLGIVVSPLLLITDTITGIENDVRGLRIVSPPFPGTTFLSSLSSQSPPITLSAGDVIVWMAFYNGSGMEKITFGAAADQYPLARVLWEAEARAAASADGVFRVHMGYRLAAEGYALKTATNLAIFTTGEVYPPLFDLPLAYGPMTADVRAARASTPPTTVGGEPERIAFSAVRRASNGHRSRTNAIARAPVYL